MKTHLSIATFLKRLGLAVTFLSALASGIGYWGSRSYGWENFLEYIAAAHSFAPKGTIPVLGLTSPVLEVLIVLMLTAAHKTKWAVLGACILTFIFSLTI